MITMRAAEKAALVEALEVDYDTAEDAAKAVFNLSAELLARRDSIGAQIWGDSKLPLAVGPFYSVRDVQKLADSLPSGWVHAATLYSPAVLTEKATRAPSDTRFCGVCGHPRFAHFNSGCVAGEVRTKAGKITTEGCGCHF